VTHEQMRQRVLSTLSRPLGPCEGWPSASVLILLYANAARAEGDQSRRQIAKNGDANEDAHDPGHASGSLQSKRFREQVILHNRLHALNHSHRPLALALHLDQVGFGNVPGF
jgi:hypothetical protein